MNEFQRSTNPMEIPTMNDQKVEMKAEAEERFLRAACEFVASVGSRNQEEIGDRVSWEAEHAGQPARRGASQLEVHVYGLLSDLTLIQLALDGEQFYVVQMEKTQGDRKP